MGVMKSRGLRLFCAAAAIAIGTVTAALAADTLLTKDSVSRFLESFGEMKILALSEGLKAGAEAKGDGSPLAAVMKAVNASKLQAEAQAIAANHGFAGLGEWANTGKAIGQAYLYVSNGSKQSEAKAQIDKNKEGAAKEIDKLGFLSAKAKQKLKENLDRASVELSKEPPKENVAIIKEMKADIDAAVKVPGK